MKSIKQDYIKSVDLVDRINAFLSKIDNENIDKIKLELDAWDVEIIREWNLKANLWDNLANFIDRKAKQIEVDQYGKVRVVEEYEK